MSRHSFYASTEEAQLLKHIREQSGLDTGQLAALLCTTPETVRRWQRGTMRARGPALGLLRVLGMSQSWSVRAAIQIGNYNRAHPKAVDQPEIIRALSQVTTA
ncbi:helix-turn-helix domain-containing protein [Ferrimonas balearica]|uniref:helix-turn-helix domain-containing protein n=1 Tax=Ferrimonas balearica TaxID=44012 RepID=UPI001C991F4B|nr:hypothetical protein [Ferrimonas balearica]MBY5991458.1 hypothetical protein [Ferrimonas balearica]